MCGFAGIWDIDCSRGGKKDLKPIVRKILQNIAYRGPDSTNIWKSAKHGICIGHNRLKIIDTSDTSNQPMVSHCKRYIMVLNQKEQFETTSPSLLLGVYEGEYIIELSNHWNAA